MQFYYTNRDIDKEYGEIVKKISLSMDGVTAEKMHDMGMVYPKNLGVSVVRLREIAKEYHPSHVLALQLWNTQQRETRIMAYLIEEADKLTMETALKMANDIEQTELAETGALFLFFKMTNSVEFCYKCIHSKKDLVKITGFHTAARIYTQLSESECLELILLAINKAETENYHLGKSIGIFLSKLCRRDKKIADVIQNEINRFTEESSVVKKLIKDLVEQEIHFFVHK